MPTDSGGPYTSMPSLFQVGLAEARPIEAIANASLAKAIVVLMMICAIDFCDLNFSSQLILPSLGYLGMFLGS